jgi:glucokinase
MTKAGELLMRPIRESYRKQVHPLFRDAKFLVSGLDGSSAAVLGASAVGWEI